MSAQKIPLFGGIIIPIHNGNTNPLATPVITPIPTVVASPPDKALLPQGVQGTYEVHLWIRPGSGLNAEQYSVYAYLDSDPATKVLIYSQKQATTGSDVDGPPIKVLDGYPVRGNITLELIVDIPLANGYDAPDFYPIGVQAFGYYYRVGQGQQVQPERRFIGEASSDGITSGIPITLAPLERKIIHVFESNRLDEISLAFTQAALETTPGSVDIRFEDSNGDLIIPGQQIVMALGGVTIPTQAAPNFLRDPQSVYSIYQVPFGGGFIPNLNQIAVTNLKDDRAEFVHGYFTRR